MSERAFQKYCKEFGQRVRQAREAQGLTQEQMMSKGFSLRHYQRIEAGRSVTLLTLWKLARALRVNPKDLLPDS